MNVLFSFRAEWIHSIFLLNTSAYTYKLQGKFMMLIVLLDEILGGLFFAQAVVQKYYGISHFSVEFFRFGLCSHPWFLWNHTIYRLVFCIFGFCICFVIWTFHLVMYFIYKQAAPHFSWDLPRYFVQMYVWMMCWGFGSREHVHIRKFPWRIEKYA